MGIFNQHSDNQPQQQRFLRGIQGSPGVGFSLTRDGNYDMVNKKLKNVGEGVESSDAVTKHQLETAMNSKINTSPSSNIFVKKDSPEVGADLDMKGFAIKNLKVTPGGDGSATSRKYVDRKLGTKADRNDLNGYLKLDGTNQMSSNLRMNGKRIVGLTNVPAYDGEATNKKYVDTQLNDKANKNDLSGYLKIDGTSQMQGNLVMNDNRITKLPEPQLADEPATKRYVTLANNFYNNFLDLQGTAKMLGNLQMNNHRITGLTDPDSDDEATNKKYVDSHVSKSNIKPSRSPKSVFQYLMDDVNEWSTEYNVKVVSFSDLTESPHSWDKKVLNISPIKSGRNYRFRLGLQMFRMKTSEQYSLIVELYNRDYETWQRQKTFVNGTGMWVESFNTSKYQYHYGGSNTLYYTKTLIKFKKTSSSPPILVYYTVHFDDNGGDMSTYPKEFKNQVYVVAYGVVGLTDHVDPEVYDAHEAFEIDKTKMKMLVPLDMNGKKILNTSFDLKFRDIFKIENCLLHNNPQSSQNVYKILRKRNNNLLVPFNISVPVVLHSFILSSFNIKLHDKAYIEIGERITNKITRINIKNLNPIMFRIYKNGINHIHFYNTGNSQFEVDVVMTYM